MFNLFDILQTQGGTGGQNLGQQFGLSPDQSRRAMEALLPAFTIGLQRNAANDPTNLAHLFGLAGANAPRSGQAFSSPQMEMLVGQLFGSPHLSQAVIQQAATVSGVATPVLRQMLPALAGMVVAGIVHLMINQNQGAATAPASKQASPAFGFPANPYWTEMMNAFLAVGTPRSADPAPRPGAARAPSSPVARRTAAVTGRSSSAPPASGRDGAHAPVDVFQQMFQTGIEAQQENALAMQRLFDTFWQRADEPTPSVESQADRTTARPAEHQSDG